MNNLALRWETVDDHLECRWCGSGEANENVASSGSRLNIQQQSELETGEQYVMERLQPLPMVGMGILYGSLAS